MAALEASIKSLEFQTDPQEIEKFCARENYCKTENVPEFNFGDGLALANPEAIKTLRVLP